MSWMSCTWASFGLLHLKVLAVFSVCTLMPEHVCCLCLSMSCNPRFASETGSHPNLSATRPCRWWWIAPLRMALAVWWHPWNSRCLYPVCMWCDSFPVLPMLHTLTGELQGLRSLVLYSLAHDDQAKGQSICNAILEYIKQDCPDVMCSEAGPVNKLDFSL